MFTFYHGTDQPDRVIEAIMGADRIRPPFHLTHDPTVAANYGDHIVRVELEHDLREATIAHINRADNYNPVTGNTVETVIHTPAAVREFYHALHNAEVID